MIDVVLVVLIVVSCAAIAGLWLLAEALEQANEREARKLIAEGKLSAEEWAAMKAGLPGRWQ